MPIIKFETDDNMMPLGDWVNLLATKVPTPDKLLLRFVVSDGTNNSVRLYRPLGFTICKLTSPSGERFFSPYTPIQENEIATYMSSYPIAAVIKMGEVPSRSGDRERWPHAGY